MPTKPKNILLFTDTPLLGGAEHQMYLLAKALDRRKFNPILCCGPYETLNTWVNKFKSEDIQTIRLEINHKNDTAQFKILKDIIKEEKIDIVHANIWNPASCRFAFLAARATKTPFITTEHDPFKLSALKNIFKKRLVNYVSTIIAVSKDNAKTLKKLHPESAKKVTVIPNGIDLTWWKSQLLSFNPKDRTRIRTDLFDADPKTLVLLTVAELHPRKGLHFYLRAIEQLLKTLPANKQNLKFMIVGEGPQRPALETLIKKRNLQDHVKLLGRQSNIPQLMKSADIFILPSSREAFGLVNLEAMASGLPIIASKVGGIPDVIQDGKTGLLTSPDNSDKLAKTLQKLITSKTLRTSISKAGLKHVENFDNKKMARMYEKAYT